MRLLARWTTPSISCCVGAGAGWNVASGQRGSQFHQYHRGPGTHPVARRRIFTLPFALRFPLAFDGKLLGQVVRIFTDTVAGWYRRRHVGRGLPAGESGAVTVIQRANSDLRLNPHFHTVFLDGVYAPDGDGRGQMFHPVATGLTGSPFQRNHRSPGTTLA